MYFTGSMPLLTANHTSFKPLCSPEASMCVKTVIVVKTDSGLWQNYILKINLELPAKKEIV